MNPLVSMAIEVALIFGPIALFLVVKAFVPSTAGRLAWAAALALATGYSAFYFASEHGWRAATRSGRPLNLSPTALFWAMGGAMLVVLLIFTFAKTRPAGANLGQQPSQPPPLPDSPTPATAPSKAAKRTFWILMSIHCAALLAWPFLSFAALFAYGSPKPADPLTLYAVFSIWGYPVYVVAGFFWGHYKRNPKVWQVVLKTSVPMFSAVWFFLPATVTGFVEMMAAEKADIPAIIARDAKLKEQLDPVYQERINFIKTQDPEQAAREAIRRGDLAFLPTVPEGNVYPGLDFRRAMAKSPAANYQVIKASPFLSEIEKMLSKEPSHSFDKDNYFTPTFQEFLKASYAYREKFNKVMEPQLP